MNEEKLLQYIILTIHIYGVSMLTMAALILLVLIVPLELYAAFSIPMAAFGTLMVLLMIRSFDKYKKNDTTN